MAIVEISTCRLTTGTRGDSLGVTREQPAPLLAEHGTDVIDSGPSLVGKEAYLLRTVESCAQREAHETASYGSVAWLRDPREGVFSRIARYQAVVLDASVLLLMPPAGQ